MMIFKNIEGGAMNLYDLFFEGILKQIRRENLEISRKYNCKKITDLGCGTGSQCQLLSKNGFHVIGIDKTKRMIDNAVNKQINNTDFILGDITTTGFKDDVFDCAIITLVLHPNNKLTIDDIINEAKRIVKNNGIIIITDYSQNISKKGMIAKIVIQIIESFAKTTHRKNYFSFMKHGGLMGYLSYRNEQIITSNDFFNGALKTVIIHS